MPEPKISDEAWPVCICFDCTKCGCAQPWRHHAYPTDTEIVRVLPGSSGVAVKP